MDIQDIDIKLLVAFDALMDDNSLTRAGQRVGLGQPAMSHALTRLRDLFGDPLFVRTRSGMQPTPLALQLTTPVKEVLGLLKTTIDSARAFDPATCSRTFCLLMSDIGMMVYLPELLNRLKHTAPKIDLRVVPLQRERYVEAFESGKADLAIGYLPALQTGFHQRRLFSDRHVCVVSANHPRIGTSMSAEQFCGESHVVVEPSGSVYRAASEQTSTTTLLERHLAEFGMRRRIALRVPVFIIVPMIVQSTELIATVPRSLVELWPDRSGLRIFDVPHLPPEFEVNQFWHERSHNDAANRWLRAEVSSLKVHTSGG